MKKIKKGLIVIMLFSLLFSFAGCKKTEKEEFNNEVKKSIVYLYSDIYVDGEYYWTDLGSGFFVGEVGKDPQYIVTNYHIFENFKRTGGDQGESTLYVRYAKDDEEEAYFVDYNESLDIAILKIAKPTAKRQAIPIRKTDDSMTGMTVYAAGFPLIADEIMSSVSQYGMDDLSITKGCINRIHIQSKTGVKIFQIDANISGGNSGGVLVDAEGNALGVTSAEGVIAVNLTGETNPSEEDILKIPTNVNYAISIDEVIPLLEKNNIKYTLTDSKSFDVAKVLIIAIPSVIILALIIVLICVLTKRGGKTPAPLPIQNPDVTNIGPVPVLTSMSPQHGGMKLTLTGQPIIIGRDPSVCGLVFQGNTKGVSAKHCQLYFDVASQTFVLTDLNSSYGTFYNGTKLAPNVPYRLKARDSFYVGEALNTIYVNIEG